MNLPITDLTADAFVPYGSVIGPPDSTPEASGAGRRWWSETALLPPTDRPYAIGYLRLEPAPLRFDWAERHLRSAEAIIPLGGDCLVYVGPPADSPVWERFEVFRLRAGQAVILNPGIWHGAPPALDQPLTALVLLRQGTGAEDVHKETRVEGAVRIAHDAMLTSEGQETDASR